MAVSPSVRISVDGFADIVEALMSMGKKIGGERLKDAIEKGAEVTKIALENASPVGPTGNLRRAADIKAIAYKSGTVVAVVGYRRAGAASTTNSGGSVGIGPDRAFHQYWIEQGTKARSLKKGTIASNLKSFGASGNPYFAARSRRPGWSGSVVIFKPRDGRLGAVAAQHPMEKAFEATKSQAEANIRAAMLDALNQAVEECKRG